MWTRFQPNGRSQECGRALTTPCRPSRGPEADVPSDRRLDRAAQFAEEPFTLRRFCLPGLVRPRKRSTITRRGNDMSFFNDLLDRKPANSSTASKYSVMNGLIYLALGALFIVWPGSVQTIFMAAQRSRPRRAPSRCPLPPRAPAQARQSTPPLRRSPRPAASPSGAGRPGLSARSSDSQSSIEASFAMACGDREVDRVLRVPALR